MCQEATYIKILDGGVLRFLVLTAVTLKFTAFGMRRRVVTSCPVYVDDEGIMFLRNSSTK